jgi:hypothetical protein
MQLESNKIFIQSILLFQLKKHIQKVILKKETFNNKNEDYEKH